ncbi:2-alkenal reductase (NADP(+)-dependent)-like [Nicotiana tomentosiformis]|uniref:2-alkenal reductase (NADP(+)-dependent)-like n=1 Tax=Nicotiana tomentosiformis TaxID=4098 RepID=UPI00051AAE28|nr:2-alkenal reductase (NADP(+)-dependent)-like isoform X1 [Nicotiana tomentosiformis]
MADGGAAAETVAVENREWYIAGYAPNGLPNSNHLKLRTVNFSLTDNSIPDGNVAIIILYISIDPYLRTQFSGLGDGLSLPQVPINQVIRANAIGKVIRSQNTNFSEGDIVTTYMFPVAEFCVMPINWLQKINPTIGITLPDYLSCLGVPGLTAWVGIEKIGKVKEGSNVYISAAAGGVGIIAGQLAKLKGCRVVGSVGSDEKVKLLKEESGYDDAFNYRVETDYEAALNKYFPDGIDFYFDNVGGKMLEAVLNHVNQGARISLCGMISEYNKVWTERRGVRNLLNVVGKEVTMQGFMVGSYVNYFEDFRKEMEVYLKEGKVKSKHKIYDGIERFLESLTSLFSSSNVGKVIIQVTP